MIFAPLDALKKTASTIITPSLINSAGCIPNIQDCALLTTFPFHKNKNSNTILTITIHTETMRFFHI